jgi:hypothetical protein
MGMGNDLWDLRITNTTYKLSSSQLTTNTALLLQIITQGRCPPI